MEHGLGPFVIINGDDLGGSPIVNRAIVASLTKGFITSATIMANMPAFGEACDMILEEGLQDRVGVHLTLTQGWPLSDQVRGLPRFCAASGEFKARQGTRWRLTAEEARAIESEFDAQIDALIARGILPSHLDSHHHVHTQWPMAGIVIRVAHRRQIDAVRLSRNCGGGIGPLKSWYKAAFNARLVREGLAPTGHFGSAQDVAALTRFGGAIEIMTHPALGDGELLDSTGGSRLEDIAARWTQIGTLVSYRELGETIRATTGGSE